LGGGLAEGPLFAVVEVDGDRVLGDVDGGGSVGVGLAQRELLAGDRDDAGVGCPALNGDRLDAGSGWWTSRAVLRSLRVWS
jgi:hypothetical protein